MIAITKPTQKKLVASFRLQEKQRHIHTISIIYTLSKTRKFPSTYIVRSANSDSQGTLERDRLQMGILTIETQIIRTVNCCQKELGEMKGRYQNAIQTPVYLFNTLHLPDPYGPRNGYRVEPTANHISRVTEDGSEGKTSYNYLRPLCPMDRPAFVEHF